MFVSGTAMLSCVVLVSDWYWTVLDMDESEDQREILIKERTLETEELLSLS